MYVGFYSDTENEGDLYRSLHSTVFVLVSVNKVVFECLALSSDASQTSGTSGQETDEGSDRSGAAGRVRGVRSVSHDEQQSRYQTRAEEHFNLC